MVYINKLYIISTHVLLFVSIGSHCYINVDLGKCKAVIFLVEA